MRFYEFFAGGGMARAGLGPDWQCLLANDIDPKKAKAYAENWGDNHLLVEDISNLATDEFPEETADLAWASFPCQDLSLAGVGAGIRGERSGTFWKFWAHMRGLNSEGRGPKIIALENVYGALKSHGGKDFAAVGSAFSGQHYRFGAVVIDAADFIPQSRPRLFIIGVRRDVVIPSELKAEGPSKQWHPKAVVEAYSGLSEKAKKKWIWWNLPIPRGRTQILSDIIEDMPTGTNWHTQAETERLLSLMTPVNLRKVDQARRAGKKMVGTIYRRTREGQQRAEVRFDDIAGCLRTPSGGSSRQTILVVDGNFIRSRLLSTREAARLMGLSDSYSLPSRYNDAYHLAGDGVAVPVVRFLAENIFEQIITENQGRDAA